MASLGAVVALLQKGEAARALADLDGLRRSHPKVADVWHLSAQAALRLGQNAEALAFVERARALAPDRPTYAAAQGGALLALGRPAEARRVLAAAQAALPADPALRQGLGRALLAEGKPVEALTWLTGPLRVEALLAAGRPAEALDALATQPVSALRHAQEGAAHAALGDPAGAAAAFDAALALQPGRESWRRSAARAHALAWSLPAAIAAWEGLLAEKPDDVEARVGLASALHRQGDDAGAWTLLAALGDRLFTDRRALAVATPLVLGKPASVPVEEALRACLAAGPADAPLLWHCVGRLREAAGDVDGAFSAHAASNAARGHRYDVAASAAQIEALRAAWPAGPSPKRARVSGGPRPIFIVGNPRSGTSLLEQILAGHPDIAAGGERMEVHRLAWSRPGGFPGDWAGLSSAALQPAAEHLRAALSRAAGGKAFITDKLPQNYLYIGLIAQLLPDAHILWCRRDPVDTALSIYFQLFGTRVPVCTTLPGLGAALRHCEALRQHWEQAALLPITLVDHEALVADPAGEVGRICAALGLSPAPAMLHPERQARVVPTASYAQVRQPISAQGIGRSRRYRAHLQPLIAALGDLCPPDLR